MRRRDKLNNIIKANILAEQRYLQSKGLLKEDLSNQEQTILDDILNEINNLLEADFNNVLKKVKDYAAKGLMTAGIISALLATPNITQAQANAIKQASNIETVDTTQQKIGVDQFIKMLDENPKAVYNKLKAGDEDLINTVKKVFIDYDNKKIDWGADEKFEDWVFNYFLKQGKAKIGSGDPRASDDLKGGLLLKDKEHYEDVLKRNKGITTAIGYNYQTEDDNIIRYLKKKIADIYWNEENNLK